MQDLILDLQDSVLHFEAWKLNIEVQRTLDEAITPRKRDLVYQSNDRSQMICMYVLYSISLGYHL